METAQVLEPAPSDDVAVAFPLSRPGRALLAILSIGAATIHLVMVPQHAADWLAMGLAFALAGWFQMGFAIAVVAAPSKRWLQLGILANLAFIAVWALSRTAGLPFGPEAHLAEAASVVDLTCIGLEAALILACAVLMVKPRLGEDLDTGSLVAASIVPVAILMATTAVLASPDAAHHAHGGADDHGSGNTVTAAGAGDHAMDHSGAAMDHSHTDAAAVPASARCDWDFNTTAFWAANPPAVDDGTHAHHHGSDAESANPPAAGAPTVGNKTGLQVWAPMTDPNACAKMKADLATMASFATKYPTAQSALDAGCIQVTKYVPGIARHIACFKYWDDNLDVNTPEMLLYGGNEAWAPMVGLSYYNYGPIHTTDWQDGQMPFHIHEGLCVKGALVIGGDGSSKEQCEAMGGKVMGKTGNMGHYWLNSCSSPDGVFSADNPRLDMNVAIYNDDPKFDPSKGGDPTVLAKNPCAGSKMTDEPAFGPPASGTTENAAAPAGQK